MNEWKQAPLGDLVKIQKGKLSAHADFPMDGYLPVINTETIAGKITVWGEPIGSVLCDENDLLLLWDGERSGLVAIGFRGIVGSTFSKLTVKSDVESNYLYHKLQNKFGWIQQQRTGTGVPHVPKNLNIILNIDFPTSITEQRKIARILSTVDAVIEKTEAAIDKYKNIKAGMMRDLFSRGIDLTTGKLRPSYEEAPELYKQSELGWVPKEWEVDILDNVVINHHSGIYKKSDLYGEGYNIVGVSDLYYHDSIDGQLFRQVPLSQTEKDSFSVNEGDLIYGESSLVLDGIAKALWVAKNGAGTVFAWHTRRIKIDRNKILSQYLYFLLSSSKIRSYIMSVATQTALTGITTKDYFNTPIIMPSSKEQETIARILDLTDKKIQTELSYGNKQKFIKQALMSDLLTGKIRVKYEEEKSEVV